MTVTETRSRTRDRDRDRWLAGWSQDVKQRLPSIRLSDGSGDESEEGDSDEEVLPIFSNLRYAFGHLSC